MAKSTAQRQAQYRQARSTAGENGERRLNTWLSTAASLALKRLANHHGLTQRQMLERLIVDLDQQILDRLDYPSPEWDRYLSVTA